MRLPFETDEGCGARARLGLIALQSDETIEYEFARLFCVSGVIVHTSRVPSSTEVSAESLAAMADHIPSAAKLFPEDAGFTAVAYACTSGTTMIGEEKVQSLIQGVLGTVPVTNPLTAAKAALKALGINRLGFVSPYVEHVSQAVRDELTSSGIEIAAFGSFDEIQERRVARITQSSVLDAAERIAGLATCDAIFLSCTNLRSFGILAETERRLGMPVISSNSALAWDLSSTAGIADCIPWPRGYRLGLANKGN